MQQLIRNDVDNIYKFELLTNVPTVEYFYNLNIKEAYPSLETELKIYKDESIIYYCNIIFNFSVKDNDITIKDYCKKINININNTKNNCKIKNTFYYEFSNLDEYIVDFIPLLF